MFSFRYDYYNYALTRKCIQDSITKKHSMPVNAFIDSINICRLTYHSKLGTSTEQSTINDTRM